MRQIAICMFFTVLFTACKKNKEILTHPVASVNVTNAVIGGGVLKMENNTQDSVFNNNYKIFNIPAGTQTQIKFSPVTTAKMTYAEYTLSASDREIYSLYITGTVVAPESFLVKDSIPPYSQDSIIRIRLVNLSPDAGPLHVTRASDSAVSVFGTMAYKNFSPFVTLLLPRVLATGATSFQVRDEANNVLYTYTLPATGTVSVASSRFKCITLSVKGSVTGTGTSAIGVVAFAHYTYI